MERISVLFLFVVGLICCTQAGTLNFNHLLCENQKNPIAIQSRTPRLSWVVDAKGFNRSQTAYQLLVASSPDLLDPENADMWNTGKVPSVQSAYIKYNGKPLMAARKYWWKVRIWDESGNPSEWSPVGNFETGLFQESSWGKAKWLCLGEDTRASEYRFRPYQTGGMKQPVMVTSQPTGYFRGEFDVVKPVKNARAYICGLGYYQLYFNGEKTGNHVLDPAPSNYDKQAYYVTYDVTNQLKEGRNVAGIILGNGFYGQNISWKRDPESQKDLAYGVPAVRMLVKIRYADGTEEEFYTDGNWRSTTGPIVFDNVYGGDTYDARYELPGWNTHSYNATNWPSAKVIVPQITKVSAQEIPPIRRIKQLEPQRIFESPVAGKWIVDFGQNLAGWVKIKVNEKAGTVINIRTTEALTQDGTDIFPGSTGGGANGMPQLYQYVCKGGGEETWEPCFSYHGFRYAEISGLSSQPTSKSIKAIWVANDVQEKGYFACSDSLLNQMHQVSKNTIMGNLHGIPEDCPHREKCGWLGDAHAYCEYALYNYELANFYKKYLEDIRTQRVMVAGNDGTDRKYPVPTMIAPGKRTSTIAKLDWGIAAIYLPWYNYLSTGDSSFVIEYYIDMKFLTEYYLSFKDEQGIIQNGMGDWCPPLWDRKQNPKAMECDPIVSANAYFYHILGIMQKFADMNRDTVFANRMQQEQVSLFEAFNRAYLQPIPLVNHYWYGSQTATVMALQFGLVPHNRLEQVKAGLRFNIIAEKGVHHSTGIHGNRYIYSLLSHLGEPMLAYRLLTTSTFPSQTYILNYGFTTWPERQFFWEDMPQLTNSLNHPMHSGFAAYFFEVLGGIKSTYEQPGYRMFTVNPIIPDTLKWCKVKVPTPYGPVSEAWSQENRIVHMTLTVPFNTKARIPLSSEKENSLLINGVDWKQQLKRGFIDLDGRFILLGSGTYEIRFFK